MPQDIGKTQYPPPNQKLLLLRDESNVRNQVPKLVKGLLSSSHCLSNLGILPSVDSQIPTQRLETTLPIAWSGYWLEPFVPKVLEAILVGGIKAAMSESRGCRLFHWLESLVVELRLLGIFCLGIGGRDGARLIGHGG